MAASDTPPGKGLSVPKNPALALRALNAQHARGTESVSPGDTSEVGENTEQEETTILQTNNTTNLPTNKQAVQPTVLPSDKSSASPARSDGRTRRIRQETSDRTTVTSMRLAVSTMEQLDEFCWRYRKRKQDVVQEALDLYFATKAQEEAEDQ